MKNLSFLGLLCCIAGFADEFAVKIRPILESNCVACHNPANPKNRHNFLKAEEAAEIAARRGLWRSVATQLRNRTMPPGAAKLSEEDRLSVATWIDARLRESGCTTGEYAGYVAPRRLNRREYHNTVRDLFGVDLAVAEYFPADESGGAGFDTNGETLYVPPMMLERYMEAAQAILERVIVTPPMNKVFLSHELTPTVPAPASGVKPGRKLNPDQELSTSVSVFAEGAYNLRVSMERPKETPLQVEVKVDGVSAGFLSYGRDNAGGATARTQLANLRRGPHTIAVVNGKQASDFYSLTIEQKPAAASPDKRALHYRLFGMDPGQAPVNARAAAQRLVSGLLAKAYRHPVEASDVERIMALYDRGEKRGDPYEESIKLALKAVLISPDFLFRSENLSLKPGIQALGQYEMASRLSYFLWSTMPDDELFGLAAQGKLQDAKVLAQQVDRMLDDPRSRAFANAFAGQWLGTQEVGGRAVPLLTELQHFYTPEVAADLREQPELLLQYIVGGNRSLLELLNGGYMFLTERLVRFYELEGKATVAGGGAFELVKWPDDQRAGVLGLAGVLAMTSHYKQGSPVLRGAWVLDTLLGTPVPPPPPDVPALPSVKKGEPVLSMRQMLASHRASTACSACHNLMDPIGMGLENFDWMGRWREREANGDLVDASGVLPSGEKFTGPVELRQLLLNRKEEFLRQLTSKALGYALGRAQQDGDQCTVQKLMDNLTKNGYQARTLIHDIVASTPFRNSQTDAKVTESSAPTKRAPRRLLGEK